MGDDLLSKIFNIKIEVCDHGSQNPSRCVECLLEEIKELKSQIEQERYSRLEEDEKRDL